MIGCGAGRIGGYVYRRRYLDECAREEVDVRTVARALCDLYRNTSLVLDL